ncbi:MAG: YkgJ family cysteine cluster protein [Candidatus Kapabacteria bacterium]|nr:YkgJ family cysteine cluster protein [Candidatus Kapabacteria bacterium]MBX7155795.1 YkgJ family cysteine cluster protein [Bacteroidota bacterium]
MSTPMFECRKGCGACCIAPSITTPLPGMPHGKPAGVRCVHLTNNNLCELFGTSLRPVFCSTLQPNPEMCGTTTEEAMDFLYRLEILTQP